jgi:DNA-binding response OmpR family regulator
MGSGLESPNWVHALHGVGVEAMTCTDAGAAMAALNRTRFDALLVDWSLRRAEATSLCSWLRHRGASTAVVALTCQADDALQIAAFRGGVDDCVEKSASPDVLALRVLGHARRARRLEGAELVRPGLRTGAGWLRVSRGPQVLLDHARLELTRAHERLLIALLEADEPVSFSQLAAAGWPNAKVSEHAVHSQVTLLRNRLSELGVRLELLRTRGYVLSLKHEPFSQQGGLDAASQG